MNLETFEQLGLSEKSLKIINMRGFEEPTEIQRKIIPLLLTSEYDFIGQAQTGTGKTAAFGLPIMEKISENSHSVQAVVLVPTRELALQVSEELNSFRGMKKLQIVPIYGGQSIVDQMRKLKSGADIVVGTPGRIIDLLKRKCLVLDKVSFAVLDEADEMLNMGFLEDIETILATTNPDKRTFLFSATMPDHIVSIAKKYMREYKLVTTKKERMTVDQTDQIYYEVAIRDKFEALCRIIDIDSEFYGLIFCRTRVAVDELANKLIDRGYSAEGIHGDFSQQQRERSLDKFKRKRVNILVATDIAARGIDISDLRHVVNYSLPQDLEAYVHRIGRTGRAGKKGIAVTFITPQERRQLSTIMRMTGSEIRKGKLPSVEDIIDAKRMRMTDELNSIIAKGAHAKYLDAAAQILEGNEPLNAIAAMLHYSLQSDLLESNYGEIKDVPVSVKGKVRLFVSMGKKDGLTPKKLVHLVQNESKVRAGLIGDVCVKDSYSFITVPSNEAEIVIRSFKNKKRNKSPLINRADQGGQRQ